MLIQQLLISAGSASRVIPGDPDWPAVVQAWMSVAAAVIALLGFGAVYVQIRKLKETIQAETHGRIYEHALEVQKVMVEHPELREFFYNGVSVDQANIKRGSQQHARLLAFAELMADYLEHITLQCEHVPDDVQLAWANYRDYVVTNSPTLCRFLTRNRAHYSRKFVARCEVREHSTPP